jgi:hypothetical protein
MIRVSRSRIVVVLVVVLWPFFFDWLAQVNINGPGLIWFLLHQLYYVPLSWVGPPFFVPDPEVQFFVQTSGRLLAAVVYVGLFLGIVMLVDSRRSRRARRNA